MEVRLYLLFLLPYLCAGDIFLEPIIEKRDSSSGKCDIVISKRSDCGFVGITAKKCAERSCCWKACNTGSSCKGIPWCFHSKTMLVAKCQVEAGKKDDCGYVGIKEPECLKKGCCWKPVAKKGEPWCFQAKNKCASGWRYYGSSCYYFSPSGMNKDWPDAQAVCRSNGGNLLKIDSKEENQFITGILKSTGKKAWRWIGLNDRAREGFFVWNSERVKPTFTNWRRGEPNDANGGEDCVGAMESPYWSSVGLWNDMPCTKNSMPFICEKPASTGGGDGSGSGEGSGSGQG